MSAQFSIIFWNVWHAAQLSPGRLLLLKDRLDALIREHNPDAFGLNEVLMPLVKGAPSQILEHLQKRGYTTSFTPFGPLSKEWSTGSALATKLPHSPPETYDLGPDTTAAKRGFPGHNVKTLLANVPVGETSLTVGVNHLAHLVPYNWRTHAQHHRNLVTITTEPRFGQATILGGDFNQPKMLTARTLLARRFHRATGTLTQPTWRFGGLRYAPLRANYDNILWSKCGRITLAQFEVLPHHPSDHSPLLGRFIVT